MPPRIRYACPHCNRRIVHHPELAGQLVVCSECKGEFYEPTDPLPGKPAQQALKPLPPGPRRLRVPDGGNRRHDLAILGPRDSSDMRSIEEIVEAVLLDDNDSPPADDIPAAKPEVNRQQTNVSPQMPKSPLGNAPPLMPTPQAPAVNPARLAPSRKQTDSEDEIDFKPTAPLATPSPAVTRPAVPSLTAPGPQRPAVPQANRPIPLTPAPMAQPAGAPSKVPTATVSKPGSGPPLAGVSLKQIAEELRRRGLGVAMLTCEMGPMRNFELTFSENMTREDALVMLQQYVQTVQGPAAKPAPGRTNPLKRLWGSSE